MTTILFTFIAAFLAALVAIFFSFLCPFGLLFLIRHYSDAAEFICNDPGIAGFLRYNFTPASIFRGDSGSYFPGYCLAAFSVAGFIKRLGATAMQLSVISLGVPPIDSRWTPVLSNGVRTELFTQNRTSITL